MTEHSKCVNINSSGKEDTTVDIVSALLRQRRKQSKRRKRRNIVTAKLGYVCWCSRPIYTFLHVNDPVAGSSSSWTASCCTAPSRSRTPAWATSTTPTCRRSSTRWPSTASSASPPRSCSCTGPGSSGSRSRPRKKRGSLNRSLRLSDSHFWKICFIV